MIIGRLFSLIVSLPYRALLGLGISGGTIAGMSIGGIFGDKLESAGISGVIGGGFVAMILVIPKIMEQRRMGRESKTQEEGVIITRLTSFYETQLAASGEQITFYQKVAAERDIIATLERRSKHDVLDQLNFADQANRENVLQMNSAGITPTYVYKPKTYKEMCKDQDDKIEECKRSVAAAITPGILRPLVAATPR